MRQIHWMGLFLFLGLLTPTAYGSWELDSEFQLHIGNTLFDQLVADFRNSLAGEQTIPLSDMVIQQQVPIAINNIDLKVQYNFAPPIRDANNAREWELDSQTISAKLLIGTISASQTIEEDFGGTIIDVVLNAECHNIELDMAPNGAYVHAKLRADLIDNQVKISMPLFDANWQNGSWTLAKMDCSGSPGFDEIVKAQALKALSSIHNFDDAIHSGIATQLDKWSSGATLVLLSERELPTNRDDLHIFFDPTTAGDGATGDVLLHGNLRFVYPFVSPNQDLLYSFALDAAAMTVGGATANDSYLLLPEDMIRGLIMGEYFTGHLDRSFLSSQIPAWQSFMGSRFAQFFVWPDLLNWRKDTSFAFEFRSQGSPSLQNVANGTVANTLTADIGIPLDVRMFAPQKGQYVPYMEFFSNVSGKVNLTLNAIGVHMTLNNSTMKLQSAWSKSYLKLFHPSEYIATSAIGNSLKSTLAGQGMDFPLPSLLVGAQLSLVPSAWQLQGKNLLVHFQGNSK